MLYSYRIETCAYTMYESSPNLFYKEKNEERVFLAEKRFFSKLEKQHKYREHFPSDEKTTSMHFQEAGEVQVS